MSAVLGTMGAREPHREHLIATSTDPTTIRVLRTASLAVAGVGASITMAALGSWWAPIILLAGTAGALFVIWRTDGAAVAARALVPVLVVVTGLTVASLLGLIGLLPAAWVWAAIAAYAVAWGEYLFAQTVARSRGLTGYR